MPRHVQGLVGEVAGHVFGHEHRAATAVADGAAVIRCMGQATAGLTAVSRRNSFSSPMVGTGSPRCWQRSILASMIARMDWPNWASGLSGALLWLLMVMFIRSSRLAPYLAK